MDSKPAPALRILALTLVAAFALSACGAPAPQAPTQPSTQPAASNLAPSKPSKTELVVATQSDSITINPFDNTVIQPDLMVGMNIYDPLIEVDRDGNVVPALATSWKRLDPLTIEFQLRQGVKFHNGEDFTAEDVKFTFDQVLDPDKKHKWASTQGFIDRVEVIDPYTARIVTKQPSAIATRKIALQGIASAAYAQGDPELLNTRPNGTSSYRFVEWVKDTRLVMEAFEGGWRGTPSIQRVAWRPIKEDAARVAALVAGEIDVALGIPTDLIPQVQQNDQVEVRSVPSMRSFWLMLDNTKPDLPTAKKEVRQAINHAIDREELNRELFDGKALNMTTAVHPDSLGYNPELNWEYDPERAKQLLAQAGYPNGFTVAMHAPDGRYARDRELSHAIAGQLAKVGINVQVKNLEVGQWTDGIFNKTADPLVLYAFSDFDHDRTSTFSVSHKTGQLWSVISYPELDALIAKAESTIEDADRARVMGEAQQWTMDNAPAAYLVTLVDNYGVSKAVKWEPRPDEWLRWREASFQ